MTREEAIEVASQLVKERFSLAAQAWLGGSVALGQVTSTSDLDITILDESAVVHRESLKFAGWPVELFVHSEASIRHFVAKDIAQRKPSMARLIAKGIELLPGGGGDAVRKHCEHVLAAGPGTLSTDALNGARYALSDLVDDLRGAEPGPVCTAIAVEAWRRAGDLLLAINGHWTGSGKWLVRELMSLDKSSGTTWAMKLHESLQHAVAGETEALERVSAEVLAAAGGRLWEGYSQVAANVEHGWVGE